MTEQQQSQRKASHDAASYSLRSGDLVRQLSSRQTLTAGESSNPEAKGGLSTHGDGHETSSPIVIKKTGPPPPPSTQPPVTVERDSELNDDDIVEPVPIEGRKVSATNFNFTDQYDDITSDALYGATTVPSSFNPRYYDQRTVTLQRDHCKPSDQRRLNTYEHYYHEAHKLHDSTSYQAQMLLGQNDITAAAHEGERALMERLNQAEELTKQLLAQLEQQNKEWEELKASIQHDTGRATNSSNETSSSASVVSNSVSEDNTPEWIKKFNCYPTFDGSTDVEEFIDTFQCIVDAKKMNEEQARFLLRTCVKGKASRSISKLKNNNGTVAEMIVALRSRHGVRRSFTTVANDLKKMVRRANQTVEAFASDIEDVAYRASMTDEQRSVLTRNAFVSGLNHSAMAHYIDKRDQEKDDLEKALDLAKDYEYEFGATTSDSTTASRLSLQPAMASAPAVKTMAVNTSPDTHAHAAAITGEQPRQTLTSIMEKFIADFAEFRKEQSSFIARWDEAGRIRKANPDIQQLESNGDAEPLELARQA